MPTRPLGALTAALAVACALGPSESIAQTWPNRPVRMIVPLAPGGGTDILARLMAQRMGDTLGQTFVVENKPGAGTVIGAEMAAKSAPDGYTDLAMGELFQPAGRASLHAR